MQRTYVTYAEFCKLNPYDCINLNCYKVPSFFVLAHTIIFLQWVIFRKPTTTLKELVITFILVASINIPLGVICLYKFLEYKKIIRLGTKMSCCYASVEKANLQQDARYLFLENNELILLRNITATQMGAIDNGVAHVVYLYGKCAIDSRGGI